MFTSTIKFKKIQARMQV